LNLHKRILHLFLCFNKIKQRNNLLKQRNIMKGFLLRKSLLILKKEKELIFLDFCNKIEMLAFKKFEE
jgi:hypothetical protein